MPPAVNTETVSESIQFVSTISTIMRVPCLPPRQHPTWFPSISSRPMTASARKMGRPGLGELLSVGVRISRVPRDQRHARGRCAARPGLVDADGAWFHQGGGGRIGTSAWRGLAARDRPRHPARPAGRFASRAPSTGARKVGTVTPLGSGRHMLAFAGRTPPCWTPLGRGRRGRWDCGERVAWSRGRARAEPSGRSVLSARFSGWAPGCAVGPTQACCAGPRSTTGSRG